ncbi:MAG: response regulator [Bryobacterales bacterium]|nr:response regulator [Bryobacterales bacterium]
MTQALSNLLNNAAKYTPDGGAIAVRAEVSSGMVAISVEDSGVGIPASRIGEVFEMFARLNPEAGREHGLGIGLTLAKRLVEMHGGKVEARSEGENRGSVFTVSLPVAEGGQANSPAGAITEDEGTARDEPYTGAPRRLLIVDDNRDAAELLAMIATQMGHEVRTAHDGAEAIEAGSAFLPDTILMDLGMPNMNGYEAATQIRKLPWGANVALIALTGWGQQSDRERSRDAGFDAHLVKPVEVAEVRRALETVRHRPN